MSLYPFRFPGVNPGEALDPDPYAPGQACPHCRGVATFFYHERGAAPQLVCTDCLTGAFDSTDPTPPAPPLRVRLLGHLPGTTVGVYEYYFEPTAGRQGETEAARPIPSPARARGRRKRP